MSQHTKQFLLSPYGIFPVSSSNAGRTTYILNLFVHQARRREPQRIHITRQTFRQVSRQVQHRHRRTSPIRRAALSIIPHHIKLAIHTWHSPVATGARLPTAVLHLQTCHSISNSPYPSPYGIFPVGCPHAARTTYTLNIFVHHARSREPQRKHITRQTFRQV